jgi:hypothetical protein
MAGKDLGDSSFQLASYIENKLPEMDGISSVRHIMGSGGDQSLEATLQKGLNSLCIEVDELGPKDLTRISSSLEHAGPKTASAASLLNRDKEQKSGTTLRLPENKIESKSNQGS